MLPMSTAASGGGDIGGGKGPAWQVYCDGPLLKAVQSARLFPDSKTFVDMPMKQDPGQVLAAFEALSAVDRQDPEKMSRFVSEHFDEAGSDIVPVTPRDFSANPAFLSRIKDGRRREWARSIHGLWALLVRENVPDVSANPQRHSLLPRHHPVVVPGGRFRESYYWDTFWTIRGLVVSGMVDTAKGAVLNLLDDVDKFGFVPNGGRLYYTERSQPPLLSDMVVEVYSARPDRSFLARALPSLEAEHAFWMDFERGRAVCVPAPTPPLKTFHAMEHGTSPEGAAVLLNRYWGALNPPAPAGLDSDPPGVVGGPLSSRPPRPESYREDAEAEEVAAGAGRHGTCQELAAAAESGWDFSSRWIGVPCGARRDSSSTDEGEAAERMARQTPPKGRDGGAGAGDKPSGAAGAEAEAEGRGAFCLCETATTSVVPVDLNAFLHRAELNIARLHHALAPGEEIGGSGDTAEAEEAARGREGQGMPQLPLPPPPLLSLDEIQRRFLSRRSGSSATSWSSSSSSLAEESAHNGKAGSGAAAATADTMGGDDGRRNRPLAQKVELFLAAARARAKAMEQTMWDGRMGGWRDLLLPTGEQSGSITPACFVPMWAGMPWPVLDDGADGGAGEGGVAAPAGQSESGRRLAACVEGLRQSGLVQPGGVRTSLQDSGQQWDGRNAWPPLQWMLIQGLRRSANALTTSMPTAPLGENPLEEDDPAAAAARKLAFELEEAFLSGALTGWEATGGMMEKYDAYETGKGGGGGEYSLQVGFGWTNGVALDLLAESAQGSPSPSPPS